MSSEISDKIENDEFFRHFLCEDAKKDDLLQIMSFTDQISKLSEGLDLISTELQKQVRENHGLLLKQASNQTNLHESLDTISAQVERLDLAANKLKEKINVRYNILENQTKVLRNLHEASHLLRQISRFLQLHRRLGAADNLTQQAKILYELEPLMEDSDLKKIIFLQDEKATITTTRNKLLHLVNRDLSNGLKNGKIELITNSLQIFSNLHTLQNTINHLMDTYINDVKHSLKACFTGTDVSTLRQSTGGSNRASELKKQVKGPGKTPQLTTSQHFRSKLWTALEWLFEEEIYEILLQINFLQKSVEAIKQSSSTQKITAENIKTKFWFDLENLLKTSFEDAAPHVIQCLQQGLPKLLSAAKSLELKMDKQYQFGSKIFESLEAGYLEKCGLNLKTPLNGIDFPNQETVDAMIRSASAELNAAIVDDSLLLLVAGAINACNKDFWNKVEAHIKLGADSKQVFDIPNTSQVQNRELANTIHYHQVSTKQMIHDLGGKFGVSEAAKKILEGLNEGRTLVFAILQQLIESMTAAVNIILLSMHREPGMNTQNIATSGPSLYMKELIDFLQRNWNAHITPFNDRTSIDQCGRELAKTCIDLFIKNIAIARPLSNAGRHRLKSDCGHLETALRPVTPDLSVLGKHFRLLRSICHMITLTPENLIQNTIEEGIVPNYVILFLLFGHAKQPELASPHQAADWTNEKLLQWLDGHTSERERLELIGGALQKYRVIVQMKNISQYDAVYPIIVSFFEKCIK